MFTSRIATLFHSMIKVRAANVKDVSIITDLIRELAEYEKMLDQCNTTVQGVQEALFCDRPVAEALVVEYAGKIEGMAIYFPHFSTFSCRAGLYLEDLFVRPSARGKGLGKALLAALAKITIERNYCRMEWVVLNWNTPAITFYESLGAYPNNGWTNYRLGGESLSKLAANA